MKTSDGKGIVLQEIAEIFHHKKAKTVILFIIDGCRADTFYSVLNNGIMPHLSAFATEAGSVRYDNCVTAFPSVTITTHASIVTGTYPGIHGIVGNDWFIRKQWGMYPDADAAKRKEFYKVTREYVKLSANNDDPGIANITGNYFEIANCDLYNTKTVFETGKNISGHQPENTYSASIFEMISRGADEKELLFIDDLANALSGRILGLANTVKSSFTRKKYLSFDDKGLDRKAFYELLRYLKKTDVKKSRLFVVWLPGMDGFSHKYGASQQKEYFLKGSSPEEFLLMSMDTHFKQLHTFLKKSCRMDDTLCVVTADHGQYDCTSTVNITNESLYQHIKDNTVLMQDETLPFTSSGTIDDNCKDASLVIIGNGGACYVYVKSSSGWNTPPEHDRVYKFLSFFETLTAVDKVFVRSADGTSFNLWSNGTENPISTLDEKEYPLASERVENLSYTLRSGDIILSAKKGFYFAEKLMRGEHGTLRAEDSLVPLIFIGPSLNNNSIVSSTVRTIDIAPTLTMALGRTELPPRTILNKLETLLDSLEAFHFRTTKGYTGYPHLDAKINVETENVQSNFLCKLAYYFELGDISADTHQSLMKRYTSIVGGE